MMSDPRLRGRVSWLLMTARIHLLSPEIRRPGRTGDLIIPILDPEGADREEFLRWLVKPALGDTLTPKQLRRLEELTAGWSAAAFASLRSELQSKARRAAPGAAPAVAATAAAGAAAVPPAVAAAAPAGAAGQAGAAESGMDFAGICELVHDHLSPTIGETRRYQTLQALANCTRRCLLPDPEVSDAVRQQWLDEIRVLEAQGVS
jgi:hypothetical protein